MADNGKKWRTARYEEKEQAKRMLALREARKQAARYLRHLQKKEFPGKSLIQLLFMIVRYGPLLAGEMAVEWIELNQKNLSPEDREFLQQIKSLLAERAKQGGSLVKS